jgi:outer membrane murein-binding lipoprotein Lpp
MGMTVHRRPGTRGDRRVLKTREFKAWKLGIALALSVLLCAGCGDSSQEQALVEASEDLASARERVQVARNDVGDRRQQVEAAKTELADAERELREAEMGLREAESRIDLTATDAALFRAVQKRLLEDDDLRDVAIDADVQRGSVTLRGSVPDLELRNRAVEIAESVPGVAGVENLISVTSDPNVAAEAD